MTDALIKVLAYTTVAMAVAVAPAWFLSYFFPQHISFGGGLLLLSVSFCTAKALSAALANA